MIAYAVEYRFLNIRDRSWSVRAFVPDLMVAHEMAEELSGRYIETRVTECRLEVEL